MNDIKGYVEIVKKQFYKYFSIIFENGFNKKILDKLIEKYVEVRYFNLEQNVTDRNNLRDTVLNRIQNEVEVLKVAFNKQDVMNINEAFLHVMYLDNVGKYIKIERLVEDIINFRNEKLNLKDNSEFSKKFLKLISKNDEEKKEYIDKFSVEYFKLKKKRTDNKNVHLLSLGYNINFPKSFSAKIIQQSFDTGITAEDKLFVEYRMANLVLLEDIIKGKFNQQYIVEFAHSLLLKKVKLERVLKIISNDYQMEKINLLVQYKYFNENTKDEIYDLMRQGYKIAVRLDETFKADQTNISRLDVFSYIIVNDKLEYTNALYSNKVISKKILKV